MQHNVLDDPSRLCRSSTCRSLVLRDPGSESAGPGGGAVLAVIDCDDSEALARLRQILPETGFVELASVEAAGLMSGMGRNTPESARPALTGRQREILHYLTQGFSNKEIARVLGLSHFTVRNHVSKLLHLLNVSSRRALRAATSAR